MTFFVLRVLKFLHLSLKWRVCQYLYCVIVTVDITLSPPFESPFILLLSAERQLSRPKTHLF